MAIKAHNSSWLLIFEEIFFSFFERNFLKNYLLSNFEEGWKSTEEKKCTSFDLCKLASSSALILVLQTESSSSNSAARQNKKKTCKQRWLCTFVPPLSRYLVSYAYYDIQITSEVEMLEAVSKTKSRSSNSNPKQPISHAARAKPVALYWKLSRESRLSNIYQIYCALQKCWKKCNFFFT